MKTEQIQYQQGDVNIEPFDGIIHGYGREITDGVVRQGSATGHSHRIVGSEFTLRRFWQAGQQDAIIADILSDDCELVHEEHGTIDLPPGLWLFTVVREFDPLTGRTSYVYD